MFEDIQSQPITLTQAKREASSIFLAKVFNWMALGLVITAVAALLTVETGLVYRILSNQLFLILIVAELALVVFLSARIQRMQASTASLLFAGYSLLNGVTLSVVFLAFTRTSIAATFFITAGMFGAVALYGLVSKRDLSGFGSFLFMGLVGIVIASVVNIFLKSSSLYWVISLLGVFIFTGLTAYDVQKIKRMGEQGILAQGHDAIRKGAIMGALTLYLDFINLFLLLLRFFGNSRE